MIPTKTFPILYKRSNTGAIQQWRIEAGVDDTTGDDTTGHGQFGVEHGQVGGKLQFGMNTIREGKNIGRSNATTPLQQAEAEAEALWIKQKKKGYVETIEAAQAGEVDASIEGGRLPMLAPNKSYPNDNELQKRIKYPCYFQPKLDGMRCIAIIEEGVATMWSRTRKRIHTVPHIIEALEARFRPGAGRVELDGELYNHDYKDRFEDLLSLLRGDAPDAEGEYLNAQFHVYDCPEADITTCAGNNIGEVVVKTTDSFEDRNAAIDDLLDGLDPTCPIKRVKTVIAENLVALDALFVEAEENGYEGGMARNKDESPYDGGKRSKNLQKMKNFIDAEFEIIGAEDGRGKDEGSVAKFVCITVPGTYPEVAHGPQPPAAGTEPQEFRCRLKATYKRRQELLQKPEQWRGKKLTIRFKRWTADGVPYIPIGQGIRDYE